ncbi:hypothetical protein C5167_043347 [Papaver somniferum]|uniref:Purple acid phosphatase n=1 Tax=Papaver somniferum TaxID=3469 RepID=A0A4Y7L8I1_PAPSO|nr:hypothetical protein C5167_043347 [Papaver somniferum]
MATLSSFLIFCLLNPSLLLLCLVSGSYGEFPRFEHPVKEGASLKFLVVGDWGRRGSSNQTLVADQMGKIGETLDPDFVISVGDNFYDTGLKSVDDPAFKESFMNIYTAPSLQKQWYLVLGNHDYKGDVEAQLSPMLQKLDSRWLCLKSYIVDAEIVDFFFIDTTPFVENYHRAHTYDWRGLTSRNDYIPKYLEELKTVLKESDAKWKIVVGHHTLRSAGQHRDTRELVEQLLPILELFRMDGRLEFVTSGGGSKAWNNDIQKDKEGLEFYHDGQGFISVELTPTVAKIDFYDVFGEVMYHFSMEKNNSSIQ